jgi:hypothetical protein
MALGHEARHDEINRGTFALDHSFYVLGDGSILVAIPIKVSLRQGHNASFGSD